MSTKIFVNLPVKDLPRSMEFFERLGYSFNREFTDDNAACLVISEDIYAMLLVEPFFRRFAAKEIADTTKAVESIIALGVESREKVDELVDKAFAAGAEPLKEPMEEGSMYGRSFRDLDGHHWEVMHMDPAAVGG